MLCRQTLTLQIRAQFLPVTMNRYVSYVVDDKASGQFDSQFLGLTRFRKDWSWRASLFCLEDCQREIPTFDLSVVP